LFHQRLREIRRRSSEIKARIESFRPAADNVVEIAIGEENYSPEYDINYWSNGRFEEINEQFNAIFAQLDQANESPVNLDGLEQLMIELNHIDAAITECDSQARKELIGSFFVEDTAVHIHNVLAGQGWTHKETGHLKDDGREPYKMVYEDGSGNEVDILVNTGANPETPSFMLEVYAGDKGETFRRITKEGLYNGLKEEGTNIPGIEHRNDCAQNPNSEVFFEHSIAEANRLRAAYKTGV
jgi:hypothetical protein